MQDGWETREVSVVLPGKGVSGGLQRDQEKWCRLCFCSLSHWLTLDPNDDK